MPMRVATAAPITASKDEARAATKIILVAAVALAFAVVVYLLADYRQKIASSVTDRDSIAYWAAAQLLLSRENPYDSHRVLELQKAQGYRHEKPLVLRTPPWSLWMIIWMGVLVPYWAWATWILLLLASLVISIRLTWRMYGAEARPPTAFILVAYLFAPIPACLVAGQLGIVLLLGIVLFLWWHESHPALAGAALLIPFAKPHVSAVLWPILGIWILTRRKWSVLAGFATAVAAAVMFSLALDPNVFSHYKQMVAEAAIQYEFIPALSGVVRLVFFRRFFWIQFVPLSAAFAWSGWYYWRNRTSWDWRDDGPTLLVVSLLTAPYAWLTDETILLPAVLQALLCMFHVRKKLAIRSRLVLLVFAGLNGLLLLLLRAKIPFATGIYFWSSLVWAGWYWYATRLARVMNA
jgi:Glycosyltransferase family 87